MSAGRLVKIKDLMAEGAITVLKDGNHGANYPRADEFVDDGIPFLTAKLISENGVDFKNAPLLSAEKAKSFRFGFVKENDILLSHNATVGRVAIMPKYEGDVVIGTSLTQYRVDEKKLLPKYLYYYFKSVEFQNSLGFVMSHSTRNQVPITDQKELFVRCLDITLQDEIVRAIDPIECRIEVNRKAAATLEAMARALYRSWFVDFDPVHAKAEGRQPAHMDAATAALFPDRFGDNGLPLGWSGGKLSDVAVQKRGTVKAGKVADDTPYIGLEHMPRRSVALNEWGSAGDVGSQKSSMSKGDILFGKLRPYFHKVGIAPVDGICSTDIVVMAAKSADWQGFILSTVSSDEFVEHTNSSSSGTRMPRTNWDDMAAYPIALPNVELALCFETITKAWRDRIVAGIHENRILANLRDTLLPRLMSGELRVGAAEKIVLEAV